MLFLPQSVIYEGRSDSLMSSGRPHYQVKTNDFNMMTLGLALRPHTTRNINEGSLIPSLPPSHLEGCSIINIEYSIIVCLAGFLLIVYACILKCIDYTSYLTIVLVKWTVPQLIMIIYNCTWANLI